MSIFQTAERLSHDNVSNGYLYQRSLTAYVEAAKLVSGKVLEIGTGSGYGVELMAARCEHFTTVDKFEAGAELQRHLDGEKNVTFLQMNIPPLRGLDDDAFDFVITFQVIEHIEDDHAFLAEIERVLKPGGRLILTTPNVKTSLTRNPWHVREYTVPEMRAISDRYFSKVEHRGVFGNERVQEYIEMNRKSVERITRFDVLDLQHRLPRWLLQIPYDVLNNFNRRKLVEEDEGLVASIEQGDFYLEAANDACLDHFIVATK